MHRFLIAPLDAFFFFSDPKVVPVPRSQLPQDEVQPAGEVPGSVLVRSAHALPAHELRGRATARLRPATMMTCSLCRFVFVECVTVCRWIEGVTRTVAYERVCVCFACRVCDS